MVEPTIKGDVHLHFCDQNKPNQTANFFLSPIQLKFGMLQLDPNSTHHTKFEVNQRLFEFSKKIFSFVKFTNNVTSLNSCPKGPSHFGLKFLYKRCVSPSINSNRSDKWQRKDSLNIRKLGILCLQIPMLFDTPVQNKSFQLELN